MKIRTKFLAVAALAAIAVVCVFFVNAYRSNPYFLSIARQYSGDFYSDWEGNVFFPDGVHETWTFNENEDALKGHLYKEPGDKEGTSWGAAHLVVEAKLSKSGHYGHLGGGKRELKVIRVISSKPVPYSFETRHSNFLSNK